MKRNALAVIALIAGISGIVVGAVALSGVTATSEMQQVTFEHAEMTSDEITLIPGGIEGSTVGDTRYYNVPATSPAGGMFTGTLTVLADKTPSAGKELRETALIFEMGSIDDQIQIGGIATYDSANPALKPGEIIVRPILGGTGKYAGISGWAETTHNEGGGWKHVFHYTN